MGIFAAPLRHPTQTRTGRRRRTAPERLPWSIAGPIILLLSAGAWSLIIHAALWLIR